MNMYSEQEYNNIYVKKKGGAIVRKKESAYSGKDPQNLEKSISKHAALLLKKSDSVSSIGTSDDEAVVEDQHKRRAAKYPYKAGKKNTPKNTTLVASANRNYDTTKTYKYIHNDTSQKTSKKGAGKERRNVYDSVYNGLDYNVNKTGRKQLKLEQHSNYHYDANHQT